MLIRGQADLPGIQVVEDDVVGVDEPDPDDDASDPELAAPAAPEAMAKPVRVHILPAMRSSTNRCFLVCGLLHLPMQTLREAQRPVVGCVVVAVTVPALSLEVPVMVPRGAVAVLQAPGRAADLQNPRSRRRLKHPKVLPCPPFQTRTSLSPRSL